MPRHRVPVKRLFAYSGQHYAGYAYNDALQTARSEHVPMAYPRAGALWKTGDGPDVDVYRPVPAVHRK